MIKFNPKPKPKREKLTKRQYEKRVLECFERDFYTCRQCGDSA